MNITGATAATYTTPPATSADNRAPFHCNGKQLCRYRPSSPATLTVDCSPFTTGRGTAMLFIRGANLPAVTLEIEAIVMIRLSEKTGIERNLE